MKIYNNRKSNKVAIVGCVHGDEVFGVEVINALKDQYKDVLFIFANEKAYDQDKRFIDEDLNRAFLSKKNNHEAKLAKGLSRRLKNVDYVIDIHTTTSEIKFVPILSNFSKNIKRMLRLLNAREVVYIEKKLAEKSLMGNIDNCISLEFGEEFAKTSEAIDLIEDLIVKIKGNNFKKIALRQVYCIDGFIACSAGDLDLQNFKYSSLLKTYPILVNERAYLREGNCAMRTGKRFWKLI